MTQPVYLCIDLKSFYASVECVERGLDPFTTNLVVADPERTERTICLAITPAMKQLGIRNRCRVFEIPDSIEYFMAPPRMHLYLEYSARIYRIYLKYVSKEDIHVYSVDEAFLDVTHYQNLYGLNAKELGVRIMQDIFDTTGITATCGIGTNLYLTKIALDLQAKHTPDHIGVLTESRYRRYLWDHTPLTDFWSIGPHTAAKLEQYGIHTMRDIAMADEDFLYRLFGVDAELLIDHAWGRETVTMEDLKTYLPKQHSLSSGQILPRDYNVEEGLLLAKEMIELLSLDLMELGLTTDSITLYLGYSRTSGLSHSRGTGSIDFPTNSTRELMSCVEHVYRTIVKEGPIRRISLSCNRVAPEEALQYSLFQTPERQEKDRAEQKAVLYIKKRFGKNAILRGMSLEEAARTMERNNQIGGHRA